MVKHIVFFKLENNSDDNKEKFKQMLLNLKNEIPQIKEIEVGINFNQSPRAYDLSLITLFENKEDLKIYQEHPKHQIVVKYIKDTNITTKVVDYEI